jgi:protein-tyrosine phosphatase
MQGIRPFLRAVRAFLSQGKGWLERRVHPLRHRRAIRSAVRRVPAREVVFVCLGNICRSPYAEVALKRRLARLAVGQTTTVRSAGFLGPGRPAPETASELARRRGLDLSGHRSATLSTPNLRSADLVICMTGRQQRQLRWLLGRPDALHLGDLDPGPIDRRDIEDPFDREAEVFEAVFDRIDRAVDKLADVLLGVGLSPEASDRG